MARVIKQVESDRDEEDDEDDQDDDFSTSSQEQDQNNSSSMGWSGELYRHGSQGGPADEVDDDQVGVSLSHCS